MKMGVITVRPKTFFIAPILLLSVIIVSTQAQTAKPSSASHPQTADSAARKQLAAYMVDFRTNPEDAELRDEIIALAKTLKPAPVVPQAAQADFAKAVAQLKSAATADAFNTAAKLFEQVAAKAPWYADAYYNAASAYAKAADYGSAKRNLTLYMAAVRPGANTQDAENLQREVDRQQAVQRFQQAMQEFRANPNDAAREQIIKLALTLDPKPALPAEVHEDVGRANYTIKNASSESDFVAAAETYTKVSQLAPWVPDYYFNQGVAYEKAKRFDQAIAAFLWYLVADPTAKDADQVRERIGGLKYAKEKAIQEQQAAEARARAESTPEAIAAKKQKEYQEWLRNLDGARFVGQSWTRDQDIVWDDELVIRGTTVVWKKRITRVAPNVIVEFPVGVWLPVSQIQIVGREGQYRPFPNMPYVQDILTISENGGSITVVEQAANGVTWTFYRK